jgi:hypothetical protein
MMDLENEKTGPAFNAPESYFKESESRLLQRLGIDANASDSVIPTIQPTKSLGVTMKVDTTGIQKRARKQDPLTSKSVGVEKEVDAVGKVEIAPLTFTTNENPEWVNFSAITEETSDLSDALNIKKVTYGDLLETPQLPEMPPVPESLQVPETVQVPESLQESETAENPNPEEVGLEIISLDPTVSTETENLEEFIQETAEVSEPIVIHEVPESVGLDELESYISPINSSKSTTVEELIQQEEPQTINLEPPPTAFAPIAGRQKESATPGWLGIAASIAAIVAAYFIWNAIQPPKLEEAVATKLQQDEPTAIEAPLDEPVSTKDTIPDGLQIVEPLITGEMPKYKEPNVYTIIDAKDMPSRTKRALQDLEDNGLATFDMEDEMFEELDFESL